MCGRHRWNNSGHVCAVRTVGSMDRRENIRLWAVFAIIIAAFGLLGCVGAVGSSTDTGATRQRGVVVSAANELPVGQMAVDIGGRVGTYPLPEGVGAVKDGDAVTVWTVEGKPSAAPATPVNMVTVAVLAVLFGAVGVAGVWTVVVEKRRVRRLGMWAYA